jgi:hypothetical protein
MPTRRSILQFLATVPFVGGFVPKVGIAGGVVVVYAFAGETVTCENGHPICDFVETVELGQEQKVASQLGNWRQPSPEIGQIPIPGCNKCGAAFSNGMVYHIGSEWRLR